MGDLARSDPNEWYESYGYPFVMVNSVYFIPFEEDYEELPTLLCCQ